MTDRELLQDALDALTYVGDKDIYSDTIDALRARLAQPENDFNPDWDAMAVIVEEQQRMAKRIEELEARLAQPEQEPVGINKVIIDSIRDSSEIVAPPKREWVGLTDEEIEDEVARVLTTLTQDIWPVALSRAIEAKLKDKNNG
jgi:hypothetical protein